MKIILLLLFSLPTCIQCGLRDILMTDDEPTIGPPPSPEKTLRFVATGVSNIFWSYVTSSNFTRDETVSSKCKQSLAAVSSGLLKGDILPFHFFDASSKTPSGFIRGTMAALGNYDQCLAIDGTIEGISMKGKNCVVDLFPVRTSLTSDRDSSDPMTTGKMTFDRIAIFKRTPFFHSLCIPHHCSQTDVKHMVSTVLEPYGLEVKGHMNCDTRESTSLVHKLKLFNRHQVISLLLVSTLIVSVMVSSAIHIYSKIRFILTGQFKPVSNVVNSLSALSAVERIFWTREQTRMFYILDWLKLFVLLPVTMGHTLGSLDVPLGLFVQATHDNLVPITSSLIPQLLISDAGLAQAPAYTGIVTAFVAFPLIKNRKLNFVAAILDRIIRAIPGLAAMTALEFIWPLTGNGPLWSRVANFVTDRCTKNWWRTFLFINNFEIEGNDACPASAFYSSIDIQFLPIGLMILFLISKREILGYAACVLLSLGTSCFVSYNIIKHNVQGAFIDKNFVPGGIADFMQYVHGTGAPYLPGYLIGIVAGYLLIEKNFKLPVRNVFHAVGWLFLGYQLNCGHINLTVAHKVFDIIPKRYVFLVPVLTRPLAAAAGVHSLFALMAAAEFLSRRNKKESNDQDKSTDEEKSPSFSIFRALCRLLLPIYLTNYWAIRYLYFTSTTIIPSSALFTVLRMTSHMMFVLLNAVLVQILLISPLDYVRQKFMSLAFKTKKH